jgi:RNA polymerase sigma-70 factor (ECF subfamily)
MLGRTRALATAANRQPALGVYIRDDAGQYRPFALIVEAGAITEMTLFQIPRLFALCGLPAFLGTDL